MSNRVMKGRAKQSLRAGRAKQSLRTVSLGEPLRSQWLTRLTSLSLGGVPPPLRYDAP